MRSTPSREDLANLLGLVAKMRLEYGCWPWILDVRERMRAGKRISSVEFTKLADRAVAEGLLFYDLDDDRLGVPTGVIQHLVIARPSLI